MIRVISSFADGPVNFHSTGPAEDQIQKLISSTDFNLFSCNSATGKTVNIWNISGMFIVLWPITAKIKTRELATKPQTN